MAKSFNMETPTFRASFPYLDPSNPNNKDNPKYADSWELEAIWDIASGTQFWEQLVAQAQAMLALEYPATAAQFQWPQLKDGNAFLIPISLYQNTHLT